MIDYNKFYLVSFSVARALKSWLQYSEETLHHYIDDGKEPRLVSFGSPKKSLRIKDYETYNAPTQGYLMRELRDKYKILVVTEPIKTIIGNNKTSVIRYVYSIFDLDESKGRDWKIFDMTEDRDNYFLTQEDAMDAGLLRALDILKTRGVVWD